MAITRYVLRFFEAQNHYVDIEATYPVSGPTLNLMMAAWTPGSYMLREYARHVEGLRASFGDRTLPIDKSAKNRWVVITKGATEVTVHYRVYGHEMTVRNNFIERDFAFLNGAPTFLVSDTESSFVLDIQTPSNWVQVVTALPQNESGAFVAADLDTLIDSPIVLGNPVVDEFEVQGTTHVLAHVGDPAFWNTNQALTDVEKIVQTTVKMWGHMPYQRYVFLNAITEGRGGLEHKSSALMMTSRYASRVRKDYVDWLGLVAHEFFHTWNIKRLRPAALGPFDYENENYTTSLWIAEGFTAYYDDLMVARAGLATPVEYLERMSRNIEILQASPGRKSQSLMRSSFDAWIKLYRPDENTANTAISYYIKGAVVALLLDTKLREQSNNACTLDDVMRKAYERFSGERGYLHNDFLALIDEVAGSKISPWLSPLVTETVELDYDAALRHLGLRFAPDKKAEKAAEANEPRKSWLGASTKDDAGKLVIREIRRETPAYAAGLNVDDEIVALDDYRVTPTTFDEHLKQYTPGTAVKVIVARRQKLMTLPVTLGEKPQDKWKLEQDPEASAEAKARFAAWLWQ